ncbi:MAG: hypothetical protein ACTSU5_00400, partial [Promethearchaeota archaeon]
QSPRVVQNSLDRAEYAPVSASTPDQCPIPWERNSPTVYRKAGLSFLFPGKVLKCTCSRRGARRSRTRRPS